jgi:hypothetical protein
MQKMKNAFKPLLPLFAAAALCGAVINVPSASAVTIDINTCWSSCGTPALPNVTVATLNFNNTVANTVQFTLSNTISNLPVANSGSFISQVLFNYTGGLSSLTFTKVDFSAVNNGGSLDQGTTTNAALSFNLDLALPTSNSGGGAARFKNSESLVWTLSGAGLDASQFSTATNSTLVHIQGIGPTNAGSTKYVNGAVPIPGSVGLFGAGFAAFVVWQWKREQKRWLNE